MSRVVDLTYPLSAAVAQIEGHPPVEYRLIHTHEEHGRTNATLSFSIHMGTHIDPPYHFVEDGATIDEIPIESLMTWGIVFDVRETARPATPITLDMLLAAARPPDNLMGAIVFINTGWAERTYFTDAYYKDPPYLGQDTADWLVAQRVRGVGLTNPPDRAGGSEPPHKGDCPIHRTLLSQGVLIIENLANLDQLGAEPFDVYALPLKIAEGCGGPARVVAVKR